ncbi:hypothetical protein HJ01_01220 [Flavobacterium frigoris PS1]|uniref:Uncharacterized protein n=1 Tax=Flavobacterium frigoris (strain PS1) TaxID=1086011 RepID=H7FPW0_FLAFP|nr:hypothetical protein HJ01_01220 [Flavobacterium frigoris PS1]
MKRIAGIAPDTEVNSELIKDAQCLNIEIHFSMFKFFNNKKK